MSDPKTPEDSPKTTEENTGSVEEKKDTPENTPGDEKGKTLKLKDAIPDNGKREKQRKNLLITLGVAVVIIVAAACAFVFLIPSGGDKRGYGIRVLYRGV